VKEQLEQLLTDAVAALQAAGELPADITPDVMIERTRDRSHGDFASNLAMTLAKPARARPRDIAAKLVAAIAGDDHVE
jgi:arginyl-tRNA synthetase